MAGTKVGSSELTGGGGFTYEGRVTAVYLVLLLIKGGARGIVSSTVEKVAVQRESIDAPLDDLKITTLRNDGERVSYDTQIKRALTISAAATNTDFREIVEKSWDTIQSDDFNTGVDRVGAITDNVAKDTYRKFRWLTDAARDSHSGKEFAKKINSPEKFGKDIKKIFNDINTILNEKINSEPTDNDIWTFFKHFLLLQFETIGDGARDKEYAINHLRTSLTEPHRSSDLFDVLESIARGMSFSSGSLNQESLIQKLEGRFKLEFSKINPANILPEMRDAAQSDLKKFTREMNSTYHQVFLGLEIEENEKQIKIENFQIIDMLSEKKNIVLEAEPGTGKSTTLLQMADKLLAEIGDNIPIIISLPSLAVLQKSIIDIILARDSFSKYDQEHFRVIANKGAFVLLCDGWNEVNAKQRSFVLEEIKNFIRDYPKNPFIIATRPNVTSLPFKKSTYVYLSPLTRQQQNEIIDSVIGNQGPDILRQANKIPGLKEILRNPFYLNVFCSISENGDLPETREELINQFIIKHENQLNHKEHLERVFEEEHVPYLSHLGRVLNDQNTTVILKDDFKKIISDVGKKLNTEGLISNIPVPIEAIETLHDHHILVCHPDESHYSFQHQQLQEWYASFDVEKLILDDLEKKNFTGSVLYKTITNYVAWEESLLFAVERLSRKDSQGVRAVGKLALVTLGIDPILSAEIIAKSTQAVWDLIKKPTITFTKEWLKIKKKNRVIDFMVLTGKADFSEDLWNFFQNSKKNDRILGLRHYDHFDPDVLGNDVENKIFNLEPRVRRSILYDIAMEGGNKSIEFVSKILFKETDKDVFMDIIDILDFRGANKQVSELLETVSVDDWLSTHHQLNILEQEPFKSKVLTAKQKLLKSLSSEPKRIEYLLDLDEEGIGDYSDEIINYTIEPKSTRSDNSYNLLKKLSQKYPRRLSKAIIKKVISGKKINYYTPDFLRTDIEIDQKALLKGVRKSHDSPTSNQVIGKLLNVKAIQKLLDEFFKTIEKANGLDRKVAQDLWDYYWHLKAIFKLVLPDNLVEAVVNRKVTQLDEINEISTLLSSLGDTATRQARFELRPQLKSNIIEEIKNWTSLTLKHSNNNRNQMANLCLLMGCIGDPQLLPLLQKILDRELEIYSTNKKKSDKIFAEGKRPSQDILNIVQNIYSTAYRRAFEGFYCPELPDILLGYLNEPLFRVEAAFSLLLYIQKRSGIKKEYHHYPDYSKVAENRHLIHSGNTTKDVDPIVIIIFKCIESLLLNDDKKSSHDALKLGIVSAQMNYGRNVDTFYNILNKVGHDSLILARILIQNGEKISVDYLMRTIKEREKKYSSETYGQSDQWYIVEEAAELLAFTDQTEFLIDFCKSHRKQYQSVWKFNRLLRAIGFSTSSKAVETLKILSDEFPKLLGKHEWFAALERLSSKKAVELVVEVIFDKAKLPFIKDDIYSIRSILSDLFEKHSAVKKELCEKLKVKKAAKQRQLISCAQGFDGGLDEDLFFVIFKAANFSESEVIRCLFNSLEGISTKKIPVDGSENAYNLEPFDIAHLRKKLFENAISDNSKSNVAKDMLNKIDYIRDRYGRPLSEPRHPDISFSKAFPLEAQAVWDNIETKYVV